MPAMETIGFGDCVQILRNYCPSGKIIHHEIRVLSEDPLGYLGEHFSIKIAYEDEGEKCAKGDEGIAREVTFFLKTVPENNANFSDYVQTMGVFTKETMIYKNILSEFSKYSAGNKFVPEAYLIKPGKCIVLENLLGLGFRVFKGEYLDFEHCSSLMKTMARFHAATVIFEEKCSAEIGETFRLIDHYPEELKEGAFVFTRDHPRQKWMESTSQAVVNCIKMLPEYSYRIADSDKVKAFLREYASGFVKPSEKFRNVMTHADLWKNNVMFKRTENGDLVSLIVDFQLSRYSPPAFDILSSLYMNTEQFFLSKHFADLLDIYYDAFARQLKTFDLSPEALFPRKSFLQSVEEYKLAALIEASLYGTIVYLGDELSRKIVSDEETFREFTFINRSKYVCKEFLEDCKFRDRFCNVLCPLAENLISEIKA